MKLYHIPRTGSLAVEAMLQIADVPHETVSLELGQMDQVLRPICRCVLEFMSLTPLTSNLIHQPDGLSSIESEFAQHSVSV